MYIYCVTGIVDVAFKSKAVPGLLQTRGENSSEEDEDENDRLKISQVCCCSFDLKIKK